MAHPEDYSDDYPPWGKRARLVPLRTYSGRVVYSRKRHRFTASDAARVIRSLDVPDNPKRDWFASIISFLQNSTVAMLQKLLPFLSPSETRALYDFVTEIISTWAVSVGLDDATMKRFLRGIILYVAGLAGVTVEIKE